MGVLTQKCIKHFPTDGSAGNLTNENWFAFMSNSANWQPGEEEPDDYPLCGNGTGAG